MSWEVEYTDEFNEWWESLTEAEQKSVAKIVLLLSNFGPSLNYPYSTDIVLSRNRKLRELRIQHRGHPYRVLYAFDPRRTAILLIGGDKTGDDRWYQTNIPIAEQLYDRYLDELEESDNGQEIH
ncbi:MAG TPA: type II toxin-antitoxin system RelE/ParE family toxin [Bryobacteraceae bacterium]|nr:type II toxin-antitoxin system RelE/ParE family toxin [Bryobacteraceae bacterium]